MLHSRLLYYIDEVVSQGSIRKASIKLNIAASAISRQIIALEKNIGLPLFARSARKIELTPAGELLIRHIRDTLRDQARTLQLINQLNSLNRESVRIGMISGLASNIVTRAVIEYHEHNPGMEINLRLFTTGDQILDAVETGQVEIGFGFDFARRKTICVLHSEFGRIGAVMSQNHPLSREGNISLIDCIGFPLVLPDITTPIRHYITETLEKIQFPFRVLAESNSIEMVRNLLKSGEMITFLTKFDVESEGLIYLPVKEFEKHSQSLMVISNMHNDSAFALGFAKKLGDFIK